MFEKDCFDIYQPDAVFAGGIAQVKKVIDACHEHDRTYSPHTWTNGIGFYVNWNLALADQKSQHPLEFPLEEPGWDSRISRGDHRPDHTRRKRHTSGLPKARPRLRDRQAAAPQIRQSASSNSARPASNSASSAKRASRRLSKSRNAKRWGVSDDAHDLVRTVGFFDRFRLRL